MQKKSKKYNSYQNGEFSAIQLSLAYLSDISFYTLKT